MAAPPQDSDPQSASMLYKILLPADYHAMPKEENAQWAGAGIDLSDNFIHLSTAGQLPGTLSRFFSSSSGCGDEVWILGADKKQLEQTKDVRWEPAAGTIFAHIYGAIAPSKDFTVEYKLQRGSDGEFELPEQLVA